MQPALHMHEKMREVITSHRFCDQMQENAKRKHSDATRAA